MREITLKNVLGFIFEILRILVVMFVILGAYAIFNSYVLEWLGGIHILGGSWLELVFFLLQAGGILILITVFYRNKLKLSGAMREYQPPFAPETARKMVIAGIAAIAVSYVILFALAIFS